jgi:hypothetical protein
MPSLENDKEWMRSIELKERNKFALGVAKE